jgi:hypothetical protein
MIMTKVYYILILKFLDAILKAVAHGTGEWTRDEYKQLHQDAVILADRIEKDGFA